MLKAQNSLSEERQLNLFKNMSDAFAYCEVIYDQDNIPADFITLDANETMARTMGLTVEEILGKKYSELFSFFEDSPYEVIRIFSDVAATGESKRFERYSKKQNKWFSGMAFSDRKGYFGVLFFEITREKREAENLKLLNNSLINYIQFPFSNIDYEMICNDLLTLAGAKYALINIYNVDKSQITIKALAGDSSKIQTVRDAMGFNIVGSTWRLEDIEDILICLVKVQKMTRINYANAVFKEKLFHKMIKTLIREDNIGDIFGMRISNGEEPLGSIILIMPPYSTLTNYEFIELFSNQLAVVLLRANAEKSLMLSEERWHYALEGSDYGVWDWEVGTNKVLYSKKIKEMLGYREDEMDDYYEEWESRVHPEDKKLIPEAIRRYFDKEIPMFVLEHRLKCKDGSYKWILNTASALNWSEGGKPSRMVGVFKDISEQKQLEEKLKKAKERAEEADRNKSEFIANMSHELRTPLNVILGAVQLFDLYLKNDSSLNIEKLQKHLKSMKQNSLRLLRLVNNIIDTTKIDAGFYKLHLKNNNIVNVIEGITLSVSEYIKLKKVGFTFCSNIDEKLIACDIDMIERIILNLLSNAIKFTKPGDLISVSINVETDWVVISVKDNGIGIPKEKQEIIFERYKQASDLLTREHEGSGIGLSLTKALVEMHGGNIKVKSEHGEGSEFIVELPSRVLPLEKMKQESINYIPNNQNFIDRMNVEFSDIYK